MWRLVRASCLLGRLGRQHLAVRDPDLLAVELGEGEPREVLIVGLAVVSQDPDGLGLPDLKTGAVRAVMDARGAASDADVAGQLVTRSNTWAPPKVTKPPWLDDRRYGLARSKASGPKLVMIRAASKKGLKHDVLVDVLAHRPHAVDVVRVRLEVHG